MRDVTAFDHLSENDIEPIKSFRQFLRENESISLIAIYALPDEKEAERESLDNDRSGVGRGSRTGVGWIKAAIISTLLLK